MAEEIVLQELFDDIVYRDVIVHNKIRDVNAVRELTAYLVENMVYLALRRKTGDISYFDDDGECDFIIRDRHTVTAAVQACIKLTDEDKDREIEGLRKAMETFDLPSGTIVTEDQRERLTFGTRHIDVIPFWDWAL